MSKNRVEKMINFLVANNCEYIAQNIKYSPENLQELCDGAGFKGGDVGFTSAVEICHLPMMSKAASSMMSGYTETSSTILSAQGVEYDSQDLLLEVVGFPSAEQGATSHESTKARALQWCLDHRPFINVRGSSKLFPDRDHRMLTFLFPHLDPWGIGGFLNPQRSKDQFISFERQLKNLLMRYDEPFLKDPNFAFVGWNVVQKLETNVNMNFRVKGTEYEGLAHEIVESQDVIRDMCERWEKNPYLQPSNRQEKRALRLLNKLTSISRSLKGSNGHKVHMRNEIRALLKGYGCPALFITLNPHDFNSKLLHILAGYDPDTWSDLNENMRARHVADNPDAAAQFFDITIKAFIRYILRYNDSRPGLFGKCSAYYGTVEAQGRGSLHCHMLVWLEGNLSPEQLREKMLADETFKSDVFGWLESVIRCELIDMEPILGEDARRVPNKRPDRGGIPNPCATEAPMIIESMTAEELERFQLNFKEFVNELAIACNWHEHTGTCWKHLEDNEPRDDAHCRMRVDGSTRAFTDLDEETSSILLRRLHPWINNYNDVVLFLLKSNMDIKFIGSGPAAKALIYYVTDYITKPSLPTHLGLSALLYAIKQNEKKFQGETDANPEQVRKSLMTKIVNAMMGRQEMSHQQVMSYLVGGGGNYASDKFQVLYWGEIHRHIARQEEVEANRTDPGFELDDVEEVVHLDENDESERDKTEHDSEEDDESEPDDSEQIDEDYDGPVEEFDQPREIEHHEERAVDPVVREANLRVRFSTRGVTATNPCLDYVYRGTTREFERLSLWDHTRLVVKVSKKTEQSRVARLKSDESNAIRVPFSSSAHPLFSTHLSRLRSIKPVVPVLLGPSIPRGDRSLEEREQYCRAMLILFKPWRSLADLKAPDQTWIDAFENYQVPRHLRKIISNMHVENECKDARREYDDARRANCLKGPMIGGEDVFGIYGGDDDNALAQSLADNVDMEEHLVNGYLEGDGKGPSGWATRRNEDGLPYSTCHGYVI